MMSSSPEGKTCSQLTKTLKNKVKEKRKMAERRKFGFIERRL